MSTLRVPVSEHDHATGPSSAPVTVVEYGDYQCPYCREAAPVVRELLDQLAGQVRFVFRHFPLTDLHPEAVDAAYLAELAGESGRFWQAHDLLFEYQDELGPQLYTGICEQLGLSTASLEQAVQTRRYDARIEADLEGGIRSGVNGTPTFFVDGHRVDGGIAELEQVVLSALR
ncbi:MAG: DsbA family protein [Cellulomonadaceae bacterium]